MPDDCSRDSEHWGKGIPMGSSARVDRDVHRYPELTNREMTTSHGYHELLKVQVKSVMEDWSGGSHPKVS